jgi:hypothetical protein
LSNFKNSLAFSFAFDVIDGAILDTPFDTSCTEYFGELRSAVFSAASGIAA